MMSPSSWLRGSLCLLAALVLAAAVPAVADDGPARKAFRVCKDPNNPPFTDAAGGGFEDRIAALFAARLGLPVETYAFPQRLGFVRNTLRYKLPGKDYPCDIVMGVPADFGQVLPTKPYYRSTYVLVLAPGKGLDGVKSEADFLALPPERLASIRIGVFDRSPGSAWLARHKLVDSGVPYKTMNANLDEIPGDLVARELASGAIDAAVMWGPIGSYAVRQAKEVPLRVVPLASEEGVKFDYAMAMGVRFGEKAWKQQLETLIDENRDEIAAILHEYGVPLVDEAGAVASGAAGPAPQQHAAATRDAR